MKHQHGEAFMRMLYRSDDGADQEWIWNSRDGVTPFTVLSRTGKVMSHVDWQRDQYLPDYQPGTGERYFITLTHAKALEYAKAKVKQHPKIYKTADDLERLIDSMRPGESPDIATVTETQRGREQP